MSPPPNPSRRSSCRRDLYSTGRHRTTPIGSRNFSPLKEEKPKADHGVSTRPKRPGARRVYPFGSFAPERRGHRQQRPNSTRVHVFLLSVWVAGPYPSIFDTSPKCMCQSRRTYTDDSTRVQYEVKNSFILFIFISGRRVKCRQGARIF